MFFLCFIRYLSIWISLQRQNIQSRGIRRSYQLQSSRILPLGPNCPLCSPCQSQKPLWNTNALEHFCQRESPKQHGKDIKKKSKWNPGSSDHCGRNYYLRRKLLNPALAAVPEVTQVPFLLLSLEALGAKTYIIFALGEQRIIFLTTEGWPSLPHHQITVWNSWACKEGLGSHLTLC